MTYFDKIVNVREIVSSHISSNQTIVSNSILPQSHATTFLKRFNRLVFTPLGSRVMLPDFGSNIKELIDRPINSLWKLYMKKYLFECFYNKNNELWDRDFEPSKIRVSEFDIKKEYISIEITFANKKEVSFDFYI